MSNSKQNPSSLTKLKESFVLRTLELRDSLLSAKPPLNAQLLNRWIEQVKKIPVIDKVFSKNQKTYENGRSKRGPEIIVYLANDRWNVRLEGKNQISVKTVEYDKAIKQARKLADKMNSDIVVKGDSGKVTKILGYRPRPNEYEQHVLKENDYWIVKGLNNEKASFRFNTKSEAVQKAREVAKNQDATLVVHKADGSIQKRVKQL